MVIASSRDGGLRLRLNEQGTPLDVQIDRRRLRRDPQALAADIVRLCREGTAAAGERRLAELRRSGVPEQVLDRMRAVLAAPPSPGGGDPPRSGSALPGGAPSDSVPSWMGRG